jgi:hypothetical protein
LSAGDPTDSFTRTGAERLARTIRDYWASRGHVVATSLHAIEGQENMFAVLSSLKGGKPRSVVKELAKGHVPAALGVFKL